MLLLETKSLREQTFSDSQMLSLSIVRRQCVQHYITSLHSVPVYYPMVLDSTHSYNISLNRAGFRYCGAIGSWQYVCPVWAFGSCAVAQYGTGGLGGLGAMPPEIFFEKSTLRSSVFRHFCKLKWSLLQWRQGRIRIKLDRHGRARREAARRRKSEWKINFRKTKFLSQ